MYGDANPAQTSLTLTELRALLRLLRYDPTPDPMLSKLLEMFRRETRARRLLERDGRAEQFPARN